MAMFEQIVLTVVSGVVVPILLETWKARKQKSGNVQTPPSTIAQTQPASDISAPQSQMVPQMAATNSSPLPTIPMVKKESWLKTLLRIIISAISGTFFALITSVILNPDESEFTNTDAFLSIIFVYATWAILSRYGYFKR